MPKRSAGLLLYRHRYRYRKVEVLLAHPGGPFWARKDLGAWSIPKGEYGRNEDPLAAAIREFAEETGHDPPDGKAIPLGDVVQRSGKLVTGFALEGDFDPNTLKGADMMDMEWPPRSGRRVFFPEVDRVEWFEPDIARTKLLDSQAPFIDRLVSLLATTR